MQRDLQTYTVIGAALEVHKVLGRGFLEAVYQEAMAEQLRQRMIRFEQQVKLPITYKSIQLATCYRADFVVFDEVIVEIKALDALTTREQAQLLNYLKASGFQRGLLINFGGKSLQYERLIWSRAA